MPIPTNNHSAALPAEQALSQTQPVIDAAAALRAISSALHQAHALGLAVNIAVVDASGLLTGFVRMPGAPLHSIDIAVDKAYTAVSFGLATSLWHEALQQHSQAVRDGLLRRPRFVGFGGGLPINEGGKRIGAIGVSGASENQDEIIARAGLQALGL